MIYFIASLIIQCIVYLKLRRVLVIAIDTAISVALDAVCDSMTREFFRRESDFQARARMRNIREKIINES